MTKKYRVCPTCSERFDLSVRQCPEDGARLLVVTDADESLVGQCLDGRFTIVRMLGAGGFGAVYRAIQHPIEREVAIKVLKAEHASKMEQVTRFFTEAKAISRLRNPHTIQLHDFGQTDDGTLYMAIELSPGRPLSDVLRSEGPFTPERAVHVIAQVCESVAEAHTSEHAIIHRDLKPDNIMLEQRRRDPDFVKVLDFGIAKLRDPDQTSSLTRTGVIQGTPTYMSPEQARGEKITPSSDLYSSTRSVRLLGRWPKARHAARKRQRRGLVPSRPTRRLRRSSTPGRGLRPRRCSRSSAPSSRAR